MRADYDSRQEIFRNLLERLKKGKDDKNLTAMSNTADWKIIPFAQNILSLDQIIELIQKQTQYLHEVHAVSFVNIRSLEGLFGHDTVGEENGGTRKNSVLLDSKGNRLNKKHTGENTVNTSHSVGGKTIRRDAKIQLWSMMMTERRKWGILTRKYYAK